MALVPVPGYGAGDLSVEGNLAAHFDRFFLTGHMWRATWDPEGLLSTIPAIAIFALSTLLVKILVRVRVPIGDDRTVVLYSGIYRFLFVPWAGALNGSLAFALANVALWLAVAALLYRRKIFIKV